jgi:hypothetical protein
MNSMCTGGLSLPDAIPENKKDAKTQYRAIKKDYPQFVTTAAQSNGLSSGRMAQSNS